MEDNICVTGTGRIRIGGYMERLILDDQDVLRELMDYIGLCGPGAYREFAGELTLTIRPTGKPLDIRGRLGDA